MVKQDIFGVEQFMDAHETNINYNMGETCCYSLSIEELMNLIKEEDHSFNIQEQRNKMADDILNTRLTYGAIRGSDRLKTEVAKLYNNEDTEITPNDIIITNGAIGANFLTFYSLVDTGDHVIVVDPSYQQLSSLPQVFSSGKANVDLLTLTPEEKYIPNVNKLSELIQPGKTKLVVINNPNNPTGAVIPDNILEEIVELCKNHDIYILCDEVYRPLYHSIEKVPKSILQFGYDKCISTSSMSKAFSFAGLRLGWVASKNKEFIEDALNKRDYNTISVSTTDDYLASFALSHYKTILKRNYKLCTSNLELLEDFINNSKGLILWVKPQGGCTAFLRVNIPGLNTYEMCTQLATSYGCLIVPGEVFGGRPGYLRVGFGNSYEDLKGGLEIFSKYLSEKGYYK